MGATVVDHGDLGYLLMKLSCVPQPCYCLVQYVPFSPYNCFLLGFLDIMIWWI